MYFRFTYNLLQGWLKYKYSNFSLVQFRIFIVQSVQR